VSSVLLTGASGFIGERLAQQLLVDGHSVVSLSRSPLQNGTTVIEGDFAALDSLALLDAHPIDVVVHLAGVTGSASEEDAMTVNVAGTRRFFRYLIDRGVKRFVTASSIAATGCLDPDFLPRSIPMPDDHPCDSTNVYGVSKRMIEELCEYFQRVDPTLEFTLFRIGGVLPEDASLPDLAALDRVSLPFTEFGTVAVQDVVAAFAVATGRALGPGVRQLNLVSPFARSALPTVEALRQLLGERVDGIDLSFYARPGNEFASVFAIDRLADVYGFTPAIDVRTMTEVRMPA
jgi:nucleoside-diphosphate-sugar epimerase